MMIRTMAILAAAASVAAPAPLQAQERYIGEVFTMATNFCPRDSLPAEGQLLPIPNNTALFSLIGTYYGGNGRSSFALPDLRRKIALGDTGGAGGEMALSLGKRLPIGGDGADGAAIEGLGLKMCIQTQGLFPPRN